MASQLETRQTDGGTLQLQYCGRGVAMPRAGSSGLGIDTIDTIYCISRRHLFAP